MYEHKKIYLTIDDSPSADFSEKIDFLHANDIPAIIFCEGKAMKTYPDAVVKAIQKGFIIGNHSYSHPHFSKISFKKSKYEIKATDQIIENLYSKAHVPRPAKLFRFPYGDKGWSKRIHPRLRFLPLRIKNYVNEKLQKKHQQRIQSYLKTLGYYHPRFGQINYSFYANLNLDKAHDVYWTFDFLEYNAKSVDEVLSLIEKHENWDKINLTKCRVGSLIDHTSDEIALIHDHAETTEWFYLALKKCKQMNMNFDTIL